MAQISTTLDEIRQLERVYETTIPHRFLDENRHVNVQYYVHLVERGLGEIFRRVGLGERYAAADVDWQLCPGAAHSLFGRVA